jgi:hypothetical protein
MDVINLPVVLGVAITTEKNAQVREPIAIGERDVTHLRCIEPGPDVLAPQVKDLRYCLLAVT